MRKSLQEGAWGCRNFGVVLSQDGISSAIAGVNEEILICLCWSVKAKFYPAIDSMIKHHLLPLALRLVGLL